jgi:hypothetical protein
MASPASTGFTFNNDTSNFVTPAYFGERDLIKMAFAFAVPPTAQSPAAGQANTSLLVNEQPAAVNLPSATTATSQPLALVPLAVPNTLPQGLDAGKQFAVGAFDVLGNIATPGETDAYALQLNAGDVINLEAISAGLIQPSGSAYVTSPIDTLLQVYDGSGNLVATNSSEFETSDANIIDWTVPGSGTYTIKVSAQNTPGSSLTGQYELYAYRFKAYNANRREGPEHPHRW